MTDHKGIVYDLDESTYHQMKHALSSTGVRKLIPPSTPAHFREWRDTIQPSTDAFDLGKVVHALVLGEGAEFVEAQFKDWKTKAAQEARDEARRQGLVPILTKDLQTARAMAESVKASPDAIEVFTVGRPEVSVLADDPITGTPLRARFDWLNETACEAGDLKTTASAEPGQFERSAAKWGYHLQQAFYEHVAKAHGLTITRFRIVAVEKARPHPVTVHEFDDLAMHEANKLVREAIDLYAQCVGRDEWPAYPPGVHSMSLPDWLLDDEMVIQ